jgi:hypothetical protein
MTGPQCFVKDQDKGGVYGPFRNWAQACAWGDHFIGPSDALPKSERRNWCVYTEREARESGGVAEVQK